MGMPVPTRRTLLRAAAAAALLVGATLLLAPIGSPWGAAAIRGHHTVRVTNADNGHSFRLRVEDRLILTLTGPSIYAWTVPTASDRAVLKRTKGHAGSTATATFVAARTGTSSVTAVDNPRCYPACLPPSLLFRIAVTVVR